MFVCRFKMVSWNCSDGGRHIRNRIFGFNNNKTNNNNNNGNNNNNNAEKDIKLGASDSDRETLNAFY